MSYDREAGKAAAREDAIKILMAHGHTRESAERGFDDIVGKLNAPDEEEEEHGE